MGFFSWQTADTKESIWNRYSDHLCKPVNLLQPNGKPPIHEPRYEGYGDFGGVDAHAWLAHKNVPDVVDGMADDDARIVGIALESGCNRDVSSGELFSFNGEYPGSTPHGSYEQVIDAYGKTPNQLLSEGIWEKHTPPLKFPLKFSFSAEAVYEDLPASEDCPNQGYFDWNDTSDEDDDMGDWEEEDLDEEE